ncbi:MAG: MFS transporter [Pyrinomonadaceae bacterium]|nr:MFS transporter [Pyrinomonadaceae bacterium]MBP6213510.1 MFS transporter [Pyrinomonadaceae bacterium]
MTDTTEKTPIYSWYALGLLMVVYVLNFLDRSIIYILFPLIKKEMAFSDTQLALLGTTSFVIFYTVLGIPFGRIADRGSRTRIIAIGVAVWSLFSGLTAFAGDFWTLFACRVMVGVGEATLGPAAISLLSDYFPASRRATVTSIYSMGIAIGAGLAALLGGSLSSYGWRTAFMIVGFPGILFAVMVFLLREPARTADVAGDKNYSSTDWRKLLSNRAFIFLCLGYALLGLATNNLSIWGATFYSRLHKFDLATIGFWGGTLTLLAGIPATLFGGAAADWFKLRGYGRMFYGAMLSLISVPFWLLLIVTDNVYLILLANGVLLAAALGWLGAAAADVTEITGVNLRGLGIAIYFFSVNIAAYLIGSNLIGYLSDRFGATADPTMLRYALLVCPIACLLSAIMLLTGNAYMKRAA